MKQTTYNCVADIQDMFEQFWVPYETRELSSGESGVTVHTIVDKKADTLYIEQYDPESEGYIVFSFEKGTHPKSWTIDVGGSLKASLSE